jgi:hypothetical protein
MALGKKTGGRRKGSKNKKSPEHRRALEQASAKFEEAMPGAFSGDAHAFLTMIYKDPSQPLHDRINAAGKALPFEKPRLQATAVTGKDGEGPAILEVRWKEPGSSCERRKDWRSKLKPSGRDSLKARIVAAIPRTAREPGGPR